MNQRPGGRRPFGGGGNRRPARPQGGRGPQSDGRFGRPNGLAGGPGADGASGSVLAPERPAAVELPAAMSVRELADLLKVGAVQVIKELMKSGVLATMNQTIDYETAALVAGDLGFTVKEPTAAGSAAAPEEGEASAPSTRRAIAEEDEAAVVPRPPVVTVMGHV